MRGFYLLLYSIAQGTHLHSLLVINIENKMRLKKDCHHLSRLDLVKV